MVAVLRLRLIIRKFQGIFQIIYFSCNLEPNFTHRDQNREHLEVVVDVSAELRTVQVKQLGLNASFVAAQGDEHPRPLNRGETAVMIPVRVVVLQQSRSRGQRPYDHSCQGDSICIGEEYFTLAFTTSPKRAATSESGPVEEKKAEKAKRTKVDVPAPPPAGTVSMEERYEVRRSRSFCVS